MKVSETRPIYGVNMASVGEAFTIVARCTVNRG
jgi:hypothetical protein